MRLSAFVLALTLPVAALGLSQAAQAEGQRLALVVGNQDYDKIDDLDNARGDAQAVSKMLRGLGFVVFEGYDVDRAGFETLMRSVIVNTDDADEIVFFYSGHGIQIGRRNYLLTTDVEFDSIYDLPVESVTLDRVIDTLASRGSVHLAIIDACRDNPFPNVQLAGNLAADLFETKAGFDVVRTQLNSFVAFSTAPGMVAYDGEKGKHSPYASAFLEAIDYAPESDVSRLFSRVRETVFNATNGRQVPWESSTLVKQFRFLDPQGATLAAAISTPVAAGQTASPDGPSPNEAKGLPAKVTLDLPYERKMPLEKLLRDRLGIAASGKLSLVKPPENGSLVTGDSGELAYHPVVEIRRADRLTEPLTDQFVVSHDGAVEGQKTVVSIEMTVNGCDLAAGDALDPDGMGLFRYPNELNVPDALKACEEAVQAAPETARFHYQLGRAQRAAGRFEDAYRSFETAWEKGQLRAANTLAIQLSSARIDRDVYDIPLDKSRAAELWQKGIAGGDPYAMHSQGMRLLRSGETDADRQRGFELLDRAAELGHTFSMNELGIYFLSKGKDHYLPERGMSYLNASAARDDIYGYNNLGIVALEGLDGKDKNFTEAYRWFELAANGGHPKSPATLGRMIVRGQVPQADGREAMRWYDLALARGDGWGGVNAANLILNEKVSGYERWQAIIRAAKAVHLPNRKASASALKLLSKQSDRELTLAVQHFLAEVELKVSTDGIPGGETRRAVSTLAKRVGLAEPGRQAAEQLSFVAKAFWALNPSRPDVF